MASDANASDPKDLYLEKLRRNRTKLSIFSNLPPYYRKSQQNAPRLNLTLSRVRDTGPGGSQPKLPVHLLVPCRIGHPSFQEWLRSAPILSPRLDFPSSPEPRLILNFLNMHTNPHDLQTNKKDLGFAYLT